MMSLPHGSWVCISTRGPDAAAGAGRSSVRRRMPTRSSGGYLQRTTSSVRTRAGDF